MEYGVSQLSIIPLRAEPSERSEQVSQLLFGELYKIMEWQEKWVKVITCFDDYEGWISRNQVNKCSLDFMSAMYKAPLMLTTQPLLEVEKLSDGSRLFLPAGCSLTFYENGECRVGDERFHIQGELQSNREDMVSTAKTYLNAPYLWGGRTHFGIDCSGFVQTVFRQYNMVLKRDASQQAEQGRIVDFLTEVKAGDLAFFDNAEGKIVHVGLMLNSEEIIHASGKVRIDRIDHQGIYAEDQQRYTHQLRIIKRYF